MRMADLPQPVAAFFDAIGKNDTNALIEAFTRDATITNEGTDYRSSEIKDWYDQLFLRARAELFPIHQVKKGQIVTVTVVVRRAADTLEGTGQFEWRFTITSSVIRGLSIVKDDIRPLPSAVASYVLAMNTFDLDAMLATFTDDALVNDQLQEYWGKTAIRAWAGRDVIRDRVTMYVIKAVQHYGNTIVTAKVDGDYEKRGLPDPLLLAFYFSAHGDKIAQLIILRKDPIFDLGE